MDPQGLNHRDIHSLCDTLGRANPHQLVAIRHQLEQNLAKLEESLEILECVG